MLNADGHIFPLYTAYKNLKAVKMNMLFAYINTISTHGLQIGPTSIHQQFRFFTKQVCEVLVPATYILFTAINSTKFNLQQSAKMNKIPFVEFFQLLTSPKFAIIIA